MNPNFLKNIHYQFSSFQNLQEQYITPEDHKYLKQLRIPAEMIEINQKSLKLAQNRSKILFLMIFQASYQSNLMTKQKNLLHEKKLKKKIQNLKQMINERKEILFQQTKLLSQKQKKILQLKFNMIKNQMNTQAKKIKSLQEKGCRQKEQNQQKFSQLQQSFKTQKQEIKEIRENLSVVNQEISGVKVDVRNVSYSLQRVSQRLQETANVNIQAASLYQALLTRVQRINPQQKQQIRNQDGRQNKTNDEFSAISENSNLDPQELHMLENQVNRTAPSQRRRNPMEN